MRRLSPFVPLYTGMACLVIFHMRQIACACQFEVGGREPLSTIGVAREALVGRNSIGNRVASYHDVVYADDRPTIAFADTFQLLFVILM